MKRDLNLIRDLLLIIENADVPHAGRPLGISSTMPRVQHHLRLLVEAGFVRGVGQTSDGSISLRLTWSGYEFLELIRDESIWQCVRRDVQLKTQGANVAVVQSVLMERARETALQNDRLKIGSEARRQRLGLHQHEELGKDGNGIGNGNGAGNGNGNGAGNGAGNGNGTGKSSGLNRLEGSPVMAAPLDSTHFQFQIWNGEAESLPIYLL